ncbi:N-acetylglucosamine-1-phosphodiester alpha-N-acetylglucosaminidase-like [Symphorus nematophorus]
MGPGGPGGCEKRRRATAEQTAVAAGCLYAQNAGFFNATSDQRLGDVVSDGRMVRDSGGQRNAQFGIRKDGSLVFGYLSQEDVLDRSNPFVQLVSGVVWLLRKGEIYINQSPKAELWEVADFLKKNGVIDAIDLDGGGVCDAGWRGKNCSQECPSGCYGDGCRHTRMCLNGGFCNHADGRRTSNSSRTSDISSMSARAEHWNTERNSDLFSDVRNSWIS